MTFPDGRMTVTSGEEVDGHYVFFDWRHNPVSRCTPSNLETPPSWPESAPFFDGLWHYANDHIGLPLPSEWSLDGLGIHFPSYEGTLTNTGIFNLSPIGQRPQRTAQKWRGQ